MAIAAKPSPFAPSPTARAPRPGRGAPGGLRGGYSIQGRTDLMVAVMDPDTAAAGVLTRSKTCSAPVLWCRHNLRHGRARALVVNSGNANAFTGKKGSEATRITAEAMGKAVGCAANEVYWPRRG